MRVVSRLSLVLSLVLLPSLARGAPPKATPAPAASTQSAPAESNVAQLREQANAAMVDRRYVDALSLYGECAKLAPDDATILYSMGRAHEFIGDYPAAVDALTAFRTRATAAQRARIPNLDELVQSLSVRVTRLRVTSNVAGARVMLGDRVVGTTPLDRRVTAGAVTLHVELDGFFPEVRQVTLPGGGESNLEVVMGRRDSSSLLVVRSSPAGAEVMVDGAVRGTTSPSLELVVPAGEHAVTARKDGFDDARVSFVLAPGDRRETTVDLAEKRPIWQKWWFWTAAGVVVAAGAATTAALLIERSPGSGTLAPGRVSAP